MPLQEPLLALLNEYNALQDQLTDAGGATSAELIQLCERKVELTELILRIAAQALTENAPNEVCSQILPLINEPENKAAFLVVALMGTTRLAEDAKERMNAGLLMEFMEENAPEQRIVHEQVFPPSMLIELAEALQALDIDVRPLFQWFEPCFYAPDLKLTRTSAPAWLAAVLQEPDAELRVENLYALAGKAFNASLNEIATEALSHAEDAPIAIARSPEVIAAKAIMLCEMGDPQQGLDLFLNGIAEHLRRSRAPEMAGALYKAGSIAGMMQLIETMDTDERRRIAFIQIPLLASEDPGLCVQLATLILDPTFHQWYSAIAEAFAAPDLRSALERLAVGGEHPRRDQFALELMEHFRPAEPALQLVLCTANFIEDVTLKGEAFLRMYGPGDIRPSIHLLLTQVWLPHADPEAKALVLSKLAGLFAPLHRSLAVNVMREALAEMEEQLPRQLQPFLPTLIPNIAQLLGVEVAEAFCRRINYVEVAQGWLAFAWQQRNGPAGQDMIERYWAQVNRYITFHHPAVDGHFQPFDEAGGRQELQQTAEARCMQHIRDGEIEEALLSRAQEPIGFERITMGIALIQHGGPTWEELVQEAAQIEAIWLRGLSHIALANAIVGERPEEVLALADGIEPSEFQSEIYVLIAEALIKAGRQQEADQVMSRITVQFQSGEYWLFLAKRLHRARLIDDRDEAIEQAWLAVSEASLHRRVCVHLTISSLFSKTYPQRAHTILMDLHEEIMAEWTMIAQPGKALLQVVKELAQQDYLDDAVRLLGQIEERKPSSVMLAVYQCAIRAGNDDAAIELITEMAFQNQESTVNRAILYALRHARIELFIALVNWYWPKEEQTWTVIARKFMASCRHQPTVLRIIEALEGEDRLEFSLTVAQITRRRQQRGAMNIINA
jgi:hypothetical protein